jgi:hypothetical protein
MAESFVGLVKRGVQATGTAEVVGTAIVAIVGGGGALVSALHEGLAMTAAIWLGAIGFCVVIQTAIGLLWFFDRAKRLSKEERTPAEFEREIRDWLHRFHFTVTRKEDPSAHFAMEVKNQHPEMPMVIAMPKGMPWLTITGRLRFNPPEAAALSTTTFPYDLAKELGRLDLDFEAQREAGGIVGVVIRNLLYVDGTTRDFDLLNALRRARGGLVMVVAMTAIAKPRG